MKPARSRGFTLIEILVVVAIIGILSAVTTAFLSSANEKANAAAIQGELNQVEKQASLYITTYGNYGPLTLNGGNNFVWPCAQDGTTGYPWVWAMNNPGFTSTIFGSPTAVGSLANLVADMKSKSGWTNAVPTVFCVAFGTGSTASSWAISVRDPSNTKNYFCADSTGNTKYEQNAPITSPPYNTYPSPTNNFAGIVSLSPGNATCQ